MNHVEFSNKYGIDLTIENKTDVREVMWSLASTLSDLQMQLQYASTEEVCDNINSVKSFIFDYMDALRHEERTVVVSMN